MATPPRLKASCIPSRLAPSVIVRSARINPASSPNIGMHPRNDFTHRGARREDLSNAHLGKGLPIGVGNDAAAKDHNVLGVRLVMWAPESTERPMASASSAIAVATICSGVWWSPV
jgi:hypothetical protein